VLETATRFGSVYRCSETRRRGGRQPGPGLISPGPGCLPPSSRQSPSPPRVQCHHGAVHRQANFTVAPSSAYVFSVNSQSRSAWLKERSCRACNQFTRFRAPSLFTVALRVHSWRTPRDSLRIFCDRTSTEFPGHGRYVFFAHPLSRSVDGQRSPPRSPVSLHWIPLDIDKFPAGPATLQRCTFLWTRGPCCHRFFRTGTCGQEAARAFEPRQS